MTLAEFVAARLDERQAQAEGVLASGQAPSFVQYVLRLLDAQRRILARHSGCGYGIGYCDDGGKAWEHDDPTGPGCADLADLAVPNHKQHNFNPAWKVD